MTRVVVHAGPGTVIRYGEATVWVGPTASPALVDYLTGAGRELASSPTAGGELADRVAGALRAGDPEPLTPFAVTGLGPSGWLAFLHGPVQLWEGTRWSVPERNPGWLPLFLGQPATIVVGPLGAPPPPPVPGSPHDLERGVVPGGGFSLTPEPLPLGGTAAGPGPDDHAEVPAPAWPEPAGGATAAPAAGADTSPPPGPSAPPDPLALSPPAGLSAAPGVGDHPQTRTTQVPSRTVPPPPPPPRPGGVAAGQRADPSGERPLIPPGSGADPAATLTPGPQSSEAAAPPAPELTVDLAAEGTPPGEPLAPVAAPPVASSGGAVVSGVRCVRGHFNHPAARDCLRCGLDLVGNQGQVSGTRPSLGVLIRDDSVLFGLDAGYVLGTTPEGDPTVTGGLARPLRLAGPAAEEISPTHAELRLTGWDVSVVDRGSAYGTFVLRPGEDQWARLPPYQAHVLAPGSHVACGQRIVTYASPWPA